MPEARLSASPGIRVGVVVAGLGIATVGAALLESVVGVGDASPVYLVAVVLAAALLGTRAAVATSVTAVLLYDFLFTSPTLTLTVSDPAEWLSLLLFLVVAVVIGRLTALLRDRAHEADRRVREGVALVGMSRDVAMTASYEEAAAAIADRLLGDAEMTAVWITDAADGGAVMARAGVPIPTAMGTPWTLARSGSDGASEWIRQHQEAATAATAGSPDHYVVPIEEEDGGVGTLHALRVAGGPRPGTGARRLLALAADQLGIAFRRDQLRAEVTAAEVARHSDALRAAILDSVSHDLRTPIAGIRALAGGLADAADRPSDAAVHDTAAAIDRQAAQLGMLVNGLLDMGRVQAGALRPDIAPYDLADLVETAVRVHVIGAAGRRVEVAIPEDLPPVLADAVLIDSVLGNVLGNAVAHTPDGTAIRVSAGVPMEGTVAIHVDDAGPGVPPDALPHLFDRFYRVRAGQDGARHGLGMGLAIAQGFTEAMGGTIGATAGPMGGLRVTIEVPAADPEADA